MYRTQITLEILSEEPIPETMPIADILWECNEGKYVADPNKETLTPQKLSGKEMADALIEAGSDPGFFMLDDEGDPVDG